jgi:iron complex outermembrane receptor protein
LAASSPAWTADLPSELDFFAPIPTVSTATRLPSALLDTPASVTILDRAIIEASTATTIPDLLRLVPGFQVAHATGARYTATRHGVSDQLERRLEVLVNGNSVYLPTNSAVEWNLVGVALDDIERIEVVRSPNAPALGSNAMFGSINIITRRPFELAGTYLRATAGSLETAIGVARIGDRLGPMDAVATFQYTRDDGFDSIDDHKRIHNLRLHGDLDLGPNGTLDIEVGYSDGETGADGVGTPTEPFRDIKLKDSYQTITWRDTRPDGSGHRVAFTHRITTQDDSYNFFLAPDLFLPLGFLDTTAERFDLELEHTLAPGKAWRFLWGVGARYDVIESDLYLAGSGGQVSAWSGRLLAVAEWRPIESLHLNVNALTEFHEIADTYTSPRLGVNWRFADRQALRASLSRNYRVFSAGEQLADYPLVLSDGTFLRQLVKATGPGLAPEQLTSYELGYLLESPARELRFDVTLFHEELRDAASGARDPNRTTIWSGENGHWDTDGIEAQLRWAPDRETLLFAAYSHAKTHGSEFTRIDASGDPIEWESFDDATPRHTLALQVTRKLSPGWQGTLALYHLSDMRWLGEGGAVDAYTRLDARLSKKLTIGDTAVELALIAQNLTGEAYYEFRPDYVFERPGNVFDRRFFLQASIQWPGIGM